MKRAALAIMIDRQTKVRAAFIIGTFARTHRSVMRHYKQL